MLGCSRMGFGEEHLRLPQEEARRKVAKEWALVGCVPPISNPPLCSVRGLTKVIM